MAENTLNEYYLALILTAFSTKFLTEAKVKTSSFH